MSCNCIEPDKQICPIHGTIVERMENRSKVPLEPIPYPHWLEVSACTALDLCFSAESLPDIYVFRGSQMYKLVWPSLPPVDTTKGPSR